MKLWGENPTPTKVPPCLVFLLEKRKKPQQNRLKESKLQSHSKEIKERSKLDINCIHPRIRKGVAQFKTTAMQKERSFKEENLSVQQNS